jgi:O-acetyl-ADP-ribose deacetylase (regulator of RNase III)
VNGPIKTGDCVYTGAGFLEKFGVKYIIHAVGPEYNKEKSILYNSGQLYNTVYNTL